MPTTATSITSTVIGTDFLIVAHALVVFHLKSSRRLDEKISIRSSAVVLAGSLVSKIEFFRSASTYEGCVNNISQAFGLGPNASLTAPIEEGKTVAKYLARFAQAVSESPHLFDFFALVGVVSCCFYVLHNALIKAIGNSAVSSSPPESSPATSKSKAEELAVDPGTPAMDSFLKLTCLLSAMASYVLASDDQIAQAKMLGRTLLLYGHYEQVKLLKPSSPMLLILSSGFLAVSSASILTSLQTEITGYSPSNALMYVSKASPLDLHYYAIVFAMAVLATVYTTKALVSKGSNSSLYVLALLFTGLVFFGPSGIGWIYRKWGIDVKVFQVYTYLAFTIALIFTLFLCGAPGLIVMLGLTNGLAGLHGVDLNSYVATPSS